LPILIWYTVILDVDFDFNGPEMDVEKVLEYLDSVSIWYNICQPEAI
jgi:hypothetical protein